MSITERFVKIMQAELNDWLGYFEEKPTEEDVESAPKRKSYQRSDKGFHARKQGGKKYKNNRQQREHFRHQRQQENYEQQKTYDTYEEPPKTYIDPEQQYYEALEIQQGASFEEIKLAYKKAMKKYHPDRFASDAAKQKIAVELCQRINEAYEYFKQKFGR